MHFSHFFFKATVVLLLSSFVIFFNMRYKFSLRKNHEENFLEKESNEQDLCENFFAQRSYPDSAFDFAAYDKAIRQCLHDSKPTRSLTGFDLPWLQEGPDNIGGRFNVMAINPVDNNIMYAGCSTGGIFKTTDGGTTWYPVFDSQPYLSIGCITLDPDDPNIIYVGTGDVNISGYPFIGDGIYKSTDGGANWIHLGLTNERIISEIKINPTNTQIIYAGTMGLPYVMNSERGLYKSVDGGANWNQVLYVNDSTGVIDLEMDYNNPNTLYAATWNRIRNNHQSIWHGVDAHIYKTTDGGATWNILSNGLPTGDQCRISMSMSALNPQIIYCTYSDTTAELLGIYKTTNGGTSWTQQAGNGLNNPFNGQGWYSGGIFVNPTNNNELWLCGVDLYKSTNGGNNWSLGAPTWSTYVVHGDHHDVVFSSTKVFTCTDGGIFSKAFSSTTWNDAEQIPSNQFYHITVDPWNGLYSGGVQDNGTTEGNAAAVNNWQRLWGGDGFQPRYNPQDPNYFYYETQNGGIVETTDGGNSWSDVGATTDQNDRRSWDMPFLLSVHDPYTMYLATDKVYAYTAGSGFSTAISSDLTDGNIFGSQFHNVSCLAESWVDGNNLYAGTSDGNVWRSTSGGATWNDVTLGLPDRYVTSVQASPTVADRVYVTHSGYKENDFIAHIHRSENNGTSWTDISGDMPQVAVNDIFILPHHADSVLYVATDGGVYASINSGNHWERLGTGMPVCSVYDLDFDSTNHKLLAGTFARSLMSYDVDSMLYVAPSDTTQDTTFVSEISLENISFYPNPASSQLTIDNGQLTINTISIFDANGKIVWKNSPTTNHQPLTTNYGIDVSSLENGVYYLLISRKEKRVVKKFVVMH
ncbi:MAG TPA: hypothetical protein DCQ93_06915 [Bacteroidetes bacterium]|nr:hypothetical protein [Bacteroidota bacterium]